MNTSENGPETKTYLSVCVKNYGRSKTMRKRWCRRIAFNEDVPRLVEVELLSVFLNTYPGLPCNSHAPLSNLLFYCLSIACTAIVSGLGLIVCFIRLIWQQDGNVSWRRESARKGLNATSGAQFAALRLVKPVVWFARAVVNWSSRSVAKSAYCFLSQYKDL